MKQRWVRIVVYSLPLMLLVGVGVTYFRAHLDGLYDSWGRWKYERWENDRHGPDFALGIIMGRWRGWWTRQQTQSIEPTRLPLR